MLVIAILDLIKKELCCLLNLFSLLIQLTLDNFLSDQGRLRIQIEVGGLAKFDVGAEIMTVLATWKP